MELSKTAASRHPKSTENDVHTSAGSMSSDIYTRDGTAIAVFHGSTGHGLLAYGGQPGMPAGFVDIGPDGHGTEYQPFEGTVRKVTVTVARTAQAVEIRLARGDDGHAHHETQRWTLGRDAPAPDARARLAGVWRGTVHAQCEAGTIDVSIDEAGRIATRVPGNCAVSGQLSDAAAARQPRAYPLSSAVSLRVSGPRHCLPGGKALTGECLGFGPRLLAVCRTDAGGMLFLGERTDA